MLIVTDPYHALRSRLIAQDVGMVAYVSSTPTSVVTGTKNLRRHLLEAGGVAAGRVIGFDGFRSGYLRSCTRLSHWPVGVASTGGRGVSECARAVVKGERGHSRCRAASRSLES